MKCDFTYNHYQELLRRAQRDNFAITCFRDWKKVAKKPKVILLRHDVDISPEKALDFARIEKKLGISATYFVRVHGEYYHPWEKKTYPLFLEIKKLGHEIGLHFEAGYLAPIFKLDPVVLFCKEKRMLEEILDIKVESAAEHGDLPRPKNFWEHHFFTKVAKEKVGIKHYPQEEKYKELKYFSDSLKKWREGCICENLTKFDRIQLLAHADWWEKK